MAHTVFICHSSKNKPIADAACAALEAKRIPCWIAPRDIIGGEEYGEAIINALSQCQIVLLIFSLHANNSPQVRREIERAVSKEKIIVPFRIEDVLPSRAMEYALGNTHWLDAITPPMERRLAELCDTISRLLQRQQGAEGSQEAGGPVVGERAQVLVPAEMAGGGRRSTGFVVGIAAAAIAAAAAVTGVVLHLEHGANPAVVSLADKTVTSPNSTPQIPPQTKPPESQVHGQAAPQHRGFEPGQKPVLTPSIAPVASQPVTPGRVALLTPAPVAPAPAAAGSPPLTADEKARLDRVEAQIDDMEGSVGGVNSALNSMQQTMQKQGVTMNGKWTDLQSGMNTNLKKAREALNKQDADRAERYAAVAGSDMGQIKTFLGR